MEERYWLRHPSLTGHLGPYSEPDLRKALEADSFPRDSYVLVDSGQNETDRMASPYWRPATAVLGMDPPPASPAPPAVPTMPEVPFTPSRHAIRGRLRQDTAYGTARSLITVLAVVMLLFLFVGGLAAMPRGSSVSQLSVLIAIGLEALGTIAAAAFLHGMLDIADANLRRQS
tara:strand:+ start:4342 stop:4860 length:519 start_codon:yes stop_codon:yes gene_type:complete